jgi:hypothetical protein
VRTGIKISTVNSYRQANTAKHESQPVASTDEQNDININPDINFDDDGMVLVRCGAIVFVLTTV